MSSNAAAQYPIETRKGEIERLGMQADAIAPDARVLLDRIGVATGWRCLDLGCGPRGITDLLSERVGPTGQVVGLDRNEEFLAHGRAHVPPNVAFRHGDAGNTGMPSDSFDLVHMRFVAGTTSDPISLIREAVRLTRPGGIVAAQEPETDTMCCYPPHPAWDKLMTAMEAVFVSAGADVHIARRLHTLFAQAGLSDVHYRPFLLGWGANDPMIDHLPATIESLRSSILKLGLMTEEELPGVLAQCRAHLRDPGTVVRSFMVAQVWGRKAGLE